MYYFFFFHFCAQYPITELKSLTTARISRFGKHFPFKYAACIIRRVNINQTLKILEIYNFTTLWNGDDKTRIMLKLYCYCASENCNIIVSDIIRYGALQTIIYSDLELIQKCSIIKIYIL